MIKRRPNCNLFATLPEGEIVSELEAKGDYLIVRLENSNVIRIYHKDYEETATSGNHRRV